MLALDPPVLQQVPGVLPAEVTNLQASLAASRTRGAGGLWTCAGHAGAKPQANLDLTSPYLPLMLDVFRQCSSDMSALAGFPSNCW